MLRLLPLLLALACAPEPETFDITFAARVGDQPFACDQACAGVGTVPTDVQPMDLRMYVHDVALLDASGAALPMTLDENTWQGSGVVLLDFEDGTELCATGSPEMNTRISGTLEGSVDEIAALSFTVGVPEALNHLDAAVAAPPLNIPGMFWSWSGGYRYLKLDTQVPDGSTFYLHLGATECDGTPGQGFSCAHGHTAPVQLDTFNPATDVVTFDVAQVYAGVDLTEVPEEDDTISGCMSFPGDPQCGPMFAALGIPFEDGVDPGDALAFSVDAR